MATAKKIEKVKPVEQSVLSLIQQRWSPVVYADQMVELEKLALLFEAARWAPSCYNEQPWSFILGLKGEGEAHERILSCLVEQNQEWAQHAPVLGISVAHLDFSRNQKPNRHAYHDLGLAMGQLVLEAVAHDLAVHQMAGFHVEQAREVLKLPKGYDPVAAFAIGYTGDPDQAPDKLRQRDASVPSRKEVTEFLFQGVWGNPLSLDG